MKSSLSLSIGFALYIRRRIDILGAVA